MRKILISSHVPYCFLQMNNERTISPKRSPAKGSSCRQFLSKRLLVFDTTCCNTTDAAFFLPPRTRTHAVAPPSLRLVLRKIAMKLSEFGLSNRFHGYTRCKTSKQPLVVALALLGAFFTHSPYHVTPEKSRKFVWSNLPIRRAEQKPFGASSSGEEDLEWRWNPR